MTYTYSKYQVKKEEEDSPALRIMQMKQFKDSSNILKKDEERIITVPEISTQLTK